MFPDKRITVAGAGSIGCFVGGMLAAAGRQVTLLTRARVIGEIQSNGLRLTSFEGIDRQIAPTQLKVPVTRRVLGFIKRAEADDKGSPGMTPEQIAGWKPGRAFALKA
jgi:hypothetical protein